MQSIRWQGHGILANVDYTLKRSSRARSLRVTVQPGGVIEVVAPQRVPDHAIASFVASRTPWIEHAIARMRHFIPLAVSRSHYLRHREEARAFIAARLRYWKQQHGFVYGRVAIRNTRRTWGSCSRAGHLNFSYSLLFLPRHLADYVVVHELCHVREHNHSPAFWALVAGALPDYRARRAELARYVRTRERS